ncbi:MAG TPA: HEAT repeat domain-containing protein [Gemmatimonadales bacterium]|nr:HEAT repeat domain-containing protein [Gemmatimonadales bacterium]
MIRAIMALGTALLIGSAVSAQGIGRRVSTAPDGKVRMTFASRPGVCGNGSNNISMDCDDGDCGHHNTYSRDDRDGDVTTCPCEEGPVRVVLHVSGGKVTRIRAYVGGEWKPAEAGTTDLGVVGDKEAVAYLLELARTSAGHVGDEAIFPATLADSVTVWPDLFKIARSPDIPTQTKKSAVFWIGQAAGDAVTRGLDSLAEGNDVDREVRESAVFALSQQRNDVGVPALINIAKTNKDPDIRKKAIFWLGQSDDPRALALFEELLTKK